MRLLSDIRGLFQTHKPPVDRMPSTILVRILNSDFRESGWYRYRNGRDPLDEGDVADLLAGFDIVPKTVRLNEAHRGVFRDSKDVVKGYCFKWFDSAIVRYLKPLEVETPEPADGQIGLPSMGKDPRTGAL